MSSPHKEYPYHANCKNTGRLENSCDSAGSMPLRSFFGDPYCRLWSCASLWAFLFKNHLKLWKNCKNSSKISQTYKSPITLGCKILKHLEVLRISLQKNLSNLISNKLRPSTYFFLTFFYFINHNFWIFCHEKYFSVV